MKFKLVDRPPTNKRRIGDPDLVWDRHLEAALIKTLGTGKAIVVSLGLLHSSPAKGRLWQRGYRLRHRVLKGREFAAAWVDT